MKNNEHFIGDFKEGLGSAQKIGAYFLEKINPKKGTEVHRTTTVFFGDPSAVILEDGIRFEEKILAIFNIGGGLTDVAEVLIFDDLSGAIKNVEMSR